MTRVSPLVVYWWSAHPYSREYVHSQDQAGKGLSGLTSELFNDRWRNIPAHIDTAPVGVLYTADGAEDLTAVLSRMWEVLSAIVGCDSYAKKTYELFAKVQAEIDEIWSQFLKEHL
jgi:hypothetical protein